jgi:hypothetical protein
VKRLEQSSLLIFHETLAMTFGIDLKLNLREIILTILFKGW